MLDKVRRFLLLDKLPPWPRKIVVTVMGGLLFIAGIIMLVTPGPAIVLIPLGLLILGTEYQWASTAAHKVTDLLHRARQRWKDRKRSRMEETG